MSHDYISAVEKQEAKDNFKDDGSFRFDSFDILTVIKYGEPLLGSAGDEFDIDEDSSSSQGKDHNEINRIFMHIASKWCLIFYQSYYCFFINHITSVNYPLYTWLQTLFLHVNIDSENLVEDKTTLLVSLLIIC